MQPQSSFRLTGLVHSREFIGVIKVKVKQSRYTPWRRLGGEEV
jgi:hypothetical protein